MSIDEAVKVLKAKEHRGTTKWEHGPRGFLVGLRAPHEMNVYPTHFEAVAIAEKYQREDAAK